MGHKIVLIRTIPYTKLDAVRWIGANTEYIEDNSFPDIFNGSKPTDILELDEKRYTHFNSSNILVIDPVTSLCDMELDRCYDIKNEGGPIYNGGRHLSYFGAELISKEITEKMLDRNWISDSPN